ncbi:unnamed protein product [Dibothriocephalus latus]|uniref:Uncharacterized protein n=1 Tax=Dibothriocephalus latus TaxID=60516 RepID=A0A3P7MFH5_DIBLA|nr:unnamed protein product [Dibothriocephalus latus]
MRMKMKNRAELSGPKTTQWKPTDAQTAETSVRKQTCSSKFLTFTDLRLRLESGLSIQERQTEQFLK